jgi:tetratricopeptide (TPR) repeat protein
MLYLDTRFDTSIEYFKQAEKKILQLRNSESQDQIDVTPILLDIHRRLAITYCRLGLYNKALRYVKWNKQVQVDTVEKELAYRLEQEKEKKRYAPGVIDQKHAVQYLVLTLTSLNKGDMAQAGDAIELLLVTPLPILTYQRIISYLVQVQLHSVAQLVAGTMQINYPNYVLGWYVLFLLYRYNSSTQSDKALEQVTHRITTPFTPLTFWLKIKSKL